MSSTFVATETVVGVFFFPLLVLQFVLAAVLMMAAWTLDKVIV